MAAPKVNKLYEIMRAILLMSVLFFVAALAVQFRHEVFMTSEAKKHRLFEISTELIDAEIPFRMGAPREEIRARFQLKADWARIDVRGEKSPPVIAFEKEIEAEKMSERPICFLLYGGGILFLFGGMMKMSEASREKKSKTKVSE